MAGARFQMEGLGSILGSWRTKGAHFAATPWVNFILTIALVGFGSGVISMDGRMIRRISLSVVACLAVISTEVSASPYFGPVDFDISRAPGVNTWNITDISGVCGMSWITCDTGIGYIASIPIFGVMQQQELVFEFETPDYFVQYEGGHFAMGVRGDISDSTGNGQLEVRGRGIIIGGSINYPNPLPCGPTTIRNTIAMEAFWDIGNCLYGPSTEGPALYNNRRYRVHILSRLVPGPPGVPDDVENRYLISEFISGQWVSIGSGFYMEIQGSDPSPISLSGFFITEAISTRGWSIEIRNLEVYACSNTVFQCSPY